jgi:hypothetical protein
MYGKDIAYLVDAISKRTGKSDTVVKKELADKLDINIKTLDSWISGEGKTENRIGRPYVAYIRSIFEPILITERLHSLINKIFKIAPSELVCFWLACGTELILLKDSARNELLKPIKQSKYHNDEIRKRFSDVSMTIDSIQTAQIINTSGAGITNYTKRVSHHILSSHLANNICYSILKIPLLIGSSIGPRVIGLIDLYNKLEKTSEEKWQPVIVKPTQEDGALYTIEEVDTIRNIALKEYRDNLKKVIESLDYIDPETTPHNGTHAEIYATS